MKNIGSTAAIREFEFALDKDAQINVLSVSVVSIRNDLRPPSVCRPKVSRSRRSQG